MNQQTLEKYLWGAATYLRGHIDAGDYKQFIFPLLFFKRICDVYDEEYADALKESDGDAEYAELPSFHRFHIPEGAHWKDVREVTVNLGVAIQDAMRAIEKANSDTLYGVFGDADVIDDISKSGDSKKLIKILRGRLRGHGEPVFKDLSERLEQLRDKAEKGLIKSIEFVKELCKLAKETVEAEKEKATREEQQNAKAALTELFIETKTDQTPAVVERIVNDIDGIVKHVRFAGWQDSKEGERVVARSLRKALLKYQLHKDQALFDRAYAYIKEYY